MTKQTILVLGVGNILHSDEGFGIYTLHALDRRYQFPDHVSVMDGGVLGLYLLGYISAADHLIVIDAVRLHQDPGTFHRLEGEEIPKRIRSKMSMHQTDLLEALTLCQALDNVPETVILGVEPKDIETVSDTPTPEIVACIDPMIDRVLDELKRLGVTPIKRTKPHVSGHPLQNY